MSRNTPTISKIACIADVHMGNHAVLGGTMQGGMNERAMEVLRTLERALAVARIHEARNVLVLGDLFDTDRPPPMMVHAVATVFAEHHRQSQGRCPIMLLAGNHDVHSDWNHDNALSPLAFVPGVGVCEESGVWALNSRGVPSKPFRRMEALLVPHQSGVTGAQALSVAGGSVWRGDLDVLGFHAGVKDNNTALWLANSAGAVHVDDVHSIMEELGILRAVCGDWHNRQAWSFEDGREIIQVGSLCPTGFDDTSPKHGVTFLCFNEDNLTWEDSEFIPINGPRFLTTACDDASLAKLAPLLRTQFDGADYVHFKYESPEEYAAARAFLATANENGRRPAVSAKFTPTIGTPPPPEVVLPVATPLPTMIQDHVRTLPRSLFEHGATVEGVEKRALEFYARAKKG